MAPVGSRLADSRHTAVHRAAVRHIAARLAVVRHTAVHSRAVDHCRGQSAAVGVAGVVVAANSHHIDWVDLGLGPG